MSIANIVREREREYELLTASLSPPRLARGCHYSCYRREVWQAHPGRGQSPGRYGRIVALVAVCIVRPDNDNRPNRPKTILNRPPDIVGRGRSRFLPAESAELRPTSATYMHTVHAL